MFSMSVSLTFVASTPNLLVILNCRDAASSYFLFNKRESALSTYLSSVPESFHEIYLQSNLDQIRRFI